MFGELGAWQYLVVFSESGYNLKNIVFLVRKAENRQRRGGFGLRWVEE